MMYRMLWLAAGMLTACGCRRGGDDDDDGPDGGPTDTGVLLDRDGDGAGARADCDDNDPKVAPTLPETPYDGKDNDCDPSTPDDDVDGDGFLLADDCDDTNPDVSPDGTEVAGNGLDDDCNPITCLGNGFSPEPLAWALPARRSTIPGGAPPWGDLADDSDLCDETKGDASNFFTQDLDGDGFLDLVESFFCDREDLGTATWTVYEGAPGGFSTSGTDWSLPPRTQTGTTQAFAGASSNQTCLANPTWSVSSYALVDHDGDRQPDLVERFACGLEGLGDGFWRVYRGEASGFAATPVQWTLPERTSSGTSNPDLWIVAESNGSCSEDLQLSRTAQLDVDGDGRPDLVEVEACGLDEIGETAWRVFRGTDDGFSTTPTSIALPERTQWGIGGETGFFRLSQPIDCVAAGGGSAYELIDMTGDGVPDLVETFACLEQDLGVTEWHVHRGTGTGFATPPIAWALPEERSQFSDDPPEYRFVRSGAGTTCFDDEFFSSYDLFDVNGDQRPDLVEYDLCTTRVLGIDEWRVYLNTGTGFEPTHTKWPLPTRSGNVEDAGFQAYPRQAGRCTDRTDLSTYALVDLSGDGAPDLVETYVCGIDGVGAQAWRVFLGACDP